MNPGIIERASRFIASLSFIVAYALPIQSIHCKEAIQWRKQMAMWMKFLLAGLLLVVLAVAVAAGFAAAQHSLQRVRLHRHRNRYSEDNRAFTVGGDAGRGG
jgi:hypothetical protein